MAVYVAIPTYNRKGMLDRILTCFERQDTPPALAVVCNATSTDGTEEMLAEKHPSVLSLRAGYELLVDRGCA
jgi:glycosyltransferase involved in cell wall biosynthesis